MKRWLILALGVGVAAAALHSVVARSPGRREAAAASAPHREIDQASREKLEAVLREAQVEEGPRR